MSSHEIVVDTAAVERLAVHPPDDPPFWSDLAADAEPRGCDRRGRLVSGSGGCLAGEAAIPDA
ncbi:MAG TPA: hypothetical protein VFR67_28925 [Pilimelia sp.]|nr:hypothetical protein [Pilimelia sp.]